MTGTTTICMVRHGQTDWNLEGRLQGLNDIELNAAGIQQAQQLAHYFKNQEWDVVISSPLKRALKTTQIIMQSHVKPEIRLMDELLERDHGQSSGMTTTERRLNFPDEVPGQESYDELHQRASRALSKIMEQYRGSQILVVSHGELINALLFVVSQGQVGTGITRQGNGCISHVSFIDESWKVNYAGIKMEELDFYLPCGVL